MTRQAWIQYFEAINGRSPEVKELAAALAAGEFVDDTLTVQPNPLQQASVQEPVSQIQTQEQAQMGNQVPPVQFQAGTNTGTQQVYNMQVAVPSSFSLFWKQFWNWLLQAWKKPSLPQTANKYNGLVAFGFGTFFASLVLAAPMIQSDFITFSVSNFITLWIALAVIYFGFILGSFVVKLSVYRAKDVTILTMFDLFGRLLSLNLIFLAAGSLFAFIGVDTVALILYLMSLFMLGGATAYTLFSKTTVPGLDMFYKYLIATIVYSVVVIVFFVVAMMIGGELLFDHVAGNLSNMFDPSNLFYSY